MNVPKLRFKDDDGHEFPEWKEKKIDDISEKVIAGGTPSTLIKEYWQGNIRWMNSGELNLKRVYEVENRITETGLNKSSTKLIPPKCVLIGLAGQGKTRGTIAINMVELCTNQSIAAIFPNSSIFNEEFLYQNLDSRYDEIRSLSTGDGGRGGLNLQIIKSINIFLPSLPEQTKIANFLTAIDEKITQLTQKHDLLKQYKKGVMQQIFSQKLRFRDDEGGEFPEWEVNDLGNLAFKVNLKNRDLGISNVLTNSATLGIISQNDYFDRDIANKNNLNGYYIVEKDDFVYNPRISSNAPVGPIKRNKLVRGIMSPLYTIFRFKKGNLAFFEHFFETTFWHDYMKSISNFGARHDRMNITNESFFALPILLPSHTEQTKIANFFTAIDDKITQTQTQLEAVKQYKKGLLQQMFV